MATYLRFISNLSVLLSRLDPVVIFNFVVDWLCDTEGSFCFFFSQLQNRDNNNEKIV